MTPNGQALISMTGIKKVFYTDEVETHALQDIHFEIKKGEYVAKVFPLKFTTEQFAAINGTWKGRLDITSPQGQKVVLNVVVRFGTSENGQYIGHLDSPDQKAMNIPITDASYADGKLMFKVDVVKGEYNGTLAGKTITGNWVQGPANAPVVNTPLVLTR